MIFFLHFFFAVREDVPEGTIVATVFATDQDVSKSAGITVTSTRSGGGGSSGSGSSSTVTDTVIPDSITSNYLAYFIVDGNEKGHFKVRRPLLSPKYIFHLIYKMHTFYTYIYVYKLLLLFIRGKILQSLSSKKKMDKRKHKKI